MVPCNPETLDQARDRYSAAIREVYDLNDPRSFMDNRPSNKPQNVFDFEDGLRLIVSREKWIDRNIRGTHVSASFSVTSTLWQEVKVMANPIMTFRHIAFDRWRYMAGRHPMEIRREEETFLGLSEHGIPHWFIRDKEES